MPGADRLLHVTTTHEIPSRHLPNLRDVGGWPPVGGGVLGRGLLYRSAALSDPGAATFGVC